MEEKTNHKKAMDKRSYAIKNDKGTMGTINKAETISKAKVIHEIKGQKRTKTITVQ